MNKPHKSTTTPEYFFHINNEATVFFRKENNNEWRVSVALRDPRDQFNRKAGRCVARRKYFQGKSVAVNMLGGDRPSYDNAAMVAMCERKFHAARKAGLHNTRASSYTF